MATEITLVKCQDGSLRPTTQTDQELIKSWKLGQGVKIKSVMLKPRSLQHHRLYWGGLIELAFDYWVPPGRLISASENATLLRFSDWLDRKGGDSGAVRSACEVFLNELGQCRALSIESPEKSRQALHEWVKVEAGYFRYEITPGGVRKTPLSINFNAMDQDEFREFYKAAFSVVWRFILSRTFDNQKEAENAINQLLSMG